PDVAWGVGDVRLLVGAGPADRAALDGRRLDLALLGLFHELGVGDRVLPARTRVELLDHGQDHQADDQPDQEVLQQSVQLTSLGCLSCLIYLIALVASSAPITSSFYHPPLRRPCRKLRL